MITPVIMESEVEVVKNKIGQLRERGEGRVHIDIGDGLFSELLSVAPADLQGIKLDDLIVDIHLLVDDPTEYVEECVALKPERVFGQIERMGSQERFLATVAGYEVKGGLALKIETPVDAIEVGALNIVETVLLLAVPAGTTGSSFEIKVIEKIKQLRKQYHGKILLDGGINPETYKRVMAAGADEAGANSSYWKGDFGHG